jgi:hypothetical protein
VIHGHDDGFGLCERPELPAMRLRTVLLVARQGTETPTEMQLKAATELACIPLLVYSTAPCWSWVF